MALVPYRVSGPAADQRAAERLLQLPGGITLRLTQWPALSGAAAAPGPLGPSGGGGAAAAATAIERASGHYEQQQQQQQQQQQERPGPQLDNLANVGLVVWQAGFLLADFLLHEAPEGAPALGPRRRGGGLDGGGGGDWRSLTVVDLGTGSGVVGIALALAGARVFLTDLPHVVPLAAANVAANCDPRVHRACVCAYRWGDDPAAAAAAEPSPLGGVEPDVITAADVLYHEELLPPLMAALRQLSAPHTVSYVSYRVRQGGEVAAFLALAEAAGFAAEEVPDAALHMEYRRRGDSGGGGRAGGGGGGVVGMEIGDGMDDSDEDGVWQPGVAGECAADRERRPPGSYGILRLCRRDCANPPPPASAAAAADAAYPRRRCGHELTSWGEGV